MRAGRRVVTVDGRRIDLPTLIVHSVLIFGFTFLTTLMGTALAGHASPLAALWSASATALIKVLLYLAARTGAPLDGAAPPRDGHS